MAKTQKEVSVKQPLFRKHNDQLFYMYLREDVNYLVEFSTTPSKEVGGFDELEELQAYEVMESEKGGKMQYTVKLANDTTYTADSVEGLFLGIYV